MRAAWWSVVVLGLVACGGDSTKAIQQGQKSNDTGELDEDGPIIEHSPIDGAQAWQQAVAVTATVYDEVNAVNGVLVYYKRSDEVEWSSRSLDNQGADLYQANIPGEDVDGSGMHYYLEAFDTKGNMTWKPVDGPNDPWYFLVSAD